MPATLPIPNDMFPSDSGTTIAAVDMWDMFWECTDFLNGSIDFASHVDFGTAHSEDYTSKNLKPHKIQWDLVHGHNHNGSMPDGAISKWGLLKKHIDLNSVKVLWTNIKEETEGESKYVIFGGQIDHPNDPGVYMKTEIPTETDHVDLDVNVLSALDSQWANWGTPETLGYILSIETDSAAPGDPWNAEDLCVILRLQESGTDYLQVCNGIAYTYSVNFLWIVRFRAT